MSYRDLSITSLIAFASTLAIFGGLSISVAQVMESTNYKIESDTINFGGGFSSSTNYTLESTAGEVATGDSGSASFNLKAGYQQMVTSFISMSAPADVIMTPSIPGVTGGVANGSTTVTVTTDSGAGYQLNIEASESPALKLGGDSIADYIPAGADPDFSFTTNNGDAHFGYSPSGVDTIARFLDNGAACNTGVGETALACWDGLSTTPTPISRATSANTPLGATTTVNFRVGIGSGVTQAAGVYVATTTLTAIAL